MRRAVVAVCGVVAAFVVAPGARASFAGKPPIIGDQGVLPQAVALDAQGARYVAGSFYLTQDFDPGTPYQTRTATSNGGTPFVTKFDSLGNWVWTQTFGGTGTDRVAAMTVANGAVYVAGDFDSNDAGFGGLGTISANTDAADFGAGFVIALDAATGAPKTTFHVTGAQTFGGSGGGRAAATSLAVDGSALFIGGTFTSSKFGVGGSGTISSTGQTDGFVAALDTRTGEPILTFAALGVLTFAGDGNENVRGVAAENGLLYVGGDTSSTDFGIGGTGTVSTPALYNPDAFVAAVDEATGAKATAFGGDGIVTFGGSGNEQGYGVAAAGGRVYLLGTGDGLDARIDGAGSAHASINGSDAFVLALDAASGAAVSAFGGGVVFFGGTGPDGTPTGIVATSTAVYVAGALGVANAGIGGPGSVEQADGYVLALDASTGGALAGFGGDGVQTLNGGVAAGSHQVATVAGFAASATSLAVVGSAPVGTYFGAPKSKTNFPGIGGYLLLVDPASADPLNLTGANHRPVFVTPPIASPSPVVAGKPVKFKIVATDADRNKLKYSWTLGNGATSTSAGPKTTYPAAGSYDVQATVDDGKGGTATSAVLHLPVVAAGTPYFDVTKVQVALNFAKANNDVVTASGQIPLADGTSLAGKSITVNVGGASQTFLLDATGKTVQTGGTVAVTPPKNGVAKFTAVLPHGAFAQKFGDEGMTNTTISNRYTPTLVTIVFDGTVYTETMQLFWTAKVGKSGTAK